MTGHAANNVPASIAAKVGRGLYRDGAHPLGQLVTRITSEFASGRAAPDGTRFTTFGDLDPVVTVRQNFDDLLTPGDHVSRQPTDTFYLDNDRLLRCHMTAHQTTLIREGHAAFLMVGDVFRRDEIDATHYPVFHQIDGVRVWRQEALPPAARASREAAVAFVMEDLKATLSRMVAGVLGAGTASRWVDAYFPFTDPSLEMEVAFEGKWLELLGCGMVRQAILTNCGADGSVGWAFGMGVERLAMVLHAIPDIRLFWSTDARFLGQFAGAGAPGAPLVKFRPYSKFPACYKDVTFWLPPSFHDNDLYEVVRETAGDLVESVARVDAFTHPKTGRTSHCYRIMYRHMDKSLTNEEVDALQARVRAAITTTLKGELR